MIEQPLGWDDLYSHIELQKKLDTPICLDECIHSEELARAAIELARAKSSTSNLPGRGAHGGTAHPRSLPATQHSGVVRRDARSRHREGA